MPIRLPVIADSIGSIDAELRELEREMEKLKANHARQATHWVDRMLNPTVRSHERPSVEIMVSGLTPIQDHFVEAALSGLGYRMRWIGTADQKALQIGKEFGNRGQCNPTHYTVGNLVKELIRLRDEEGIPTEQIIANHVFLTAGACGPCRFGMYVTEYRKALRDAGFEGFRVMLFQQQGGLSQVSGDDLGLVFDFEFFMAIGRALIAGDILNAIGWRIRPYEVEKGATDRALEKAKQVVANVLREPKGNPWLRYMWALHQCKGIFESVQIDPLRCRARVSVIGEFWALHTEGDGNYNLKRFLEDEGAECIVQPVIATILYNIWEVARDTQERMRVRGADRALWGLGDLDELGIMKRVISMKIADVALRGSFYFFAHLAGLRSYSLPDMWRLADLAKDLYANDLRGGEGHLEVAKLVANAIDKKAHMVVSVKPFGCMPSSGVSDGVQSFVQARFGNIPFVAVETSGDGAANFYSRVLMTLFAAKRAAEEELRESYKRLGITEAQAREFLKKHPRFANPLRQPAPSKGVTGRAALLLHEIAPLIHASPTQRKWIQAKRQWMRIRQSGKAGVERLRVVLTSFGNEEGRSRLAVDLAIVRDALRRAVGMRFFSWDKKG
ncbi:MAG: 2-hydroxyglutaryl-CoA dehydratase [Sandaracinaceae bacterium]|nr:2-hydroxyglutaryl-CoA dehydratase [Sandaracinaceae bacterium]